jgi:uncharacterized protein
MKIRIDEIPEEGLSLELSEDGSMLAKLGDVVDFALEGKVIAHLDINKVGDFVSVQGSLTANTTTECSRCLKPIGAKLSLPVDEKLLLSADGAGGGEGKERELSLRDMDYTVMEAAELDINDILLEVVVLASQGNPLCKEDCKGLCYSCGKDLNASSCKCADKDLKQQAEQAEQADDGQIDKRFEALKDLKLK